MKRYALYGAGLIAAYLLLAHFKGAVQDTTAAAQGGSTIIKAFQGR